MQFLVQASFILDCALEICKKLSGNYSLYLVTNGTKIVQKGRLSGSPIMKYIKDVFISEEIGFNKPQKEYFDYVLEHIEEKDKTKILVVGDSLSSDIAGAENSGLDSCWVNTKKRKRCNLHDKLHNGDIRYFVKYFQLRFLHNVA